MKGQVGDVFRELVARKAIWVYAAFIGLSLLLGWGITSQQVRMQVEMYGQSDIRSLDSALGHPILTGLNLYISILVFLTVLAAAGSVPGMLRRGRAEFYLAKPIARPSLLGLRFAGLALVYGGLVVLASLLMIGMLSLKFNFYGIGIFWLVCGQIVVLLVWFCITTAVGIISGSGFMALMAAFLTWLAQFILHWVQKGPEFLHEGVIGRILDILYYVVPKTGEMTDIAFNLAAGSPVESWLPVWSSLLAGLVVFWLGLWVFKRKDY